MNVRPHFKDIDRDNMSHFLKEEFFAQLHISVSLESATSIRCALTIQCDTNLDLKREL